MQCFYGQDEKDSACPYLARREVEVIRTTGGHHFDGNYETLGPPQPDRLGTARWPVPRLLAGWQ